MSRTSLCISVVAAAAVQLWTSKASADAVTDWNEFTVFATKGFNGSGGAGVALDSNLSARIGAIEARAVFDAIDSIRHFSRDTYYYSGRNSGSPEAAAAQAAHDVLLAQLPNPQTDPSADARWSQTRAWVDKRLADYLAQLGVSASDGGIAAGNAAAAAANQARSNDNSAPVTVYGAALSPTSNPGVGLWRQSNAGAVFVNPATGAPTGFDAGGVIQGRPGIDSNWRDVVTFSLSNAQKVALVAAVPPSPAVGSAEYRAELEYVRDRGRDSSSVRTADQTAQALYYKQDIEIIVNEAARVASAARALPLEENAKLFAFVDNAEADARIAAFDSKYEQKFWRPITALNAAADGSVTNGYAAWHPLAATPSHPSNTAGHSTGAAAGFEALRAYFGSDKIRPDGNAVTLGSLSWLTGTNSGTGNVTTRSVSTFSQAQLETGASRLYLGVHYGYDNFQGQVLGDRVADSIIWRGADPAARGLRIIDAPASANRLESTLASQPALYGFFGRDTGAPR